MRIKKLELKNFRGFEDLVIDFPEGESGLAVLVGVNGSGKTSVLDAVARCLEPICKGLIPNGHSPQFQTIEDDIRIVPHQLGTRITFEKQLDYKFRAVIQWDLTTIEWHWGQGGGNFGEIEDAITKKRTDVITGKPVELPMIGFYQTTRYWSKERNQDVGLYPIGSRLDIYSDCLAPKISSKTLLEWFKRMEFIHFQRRGEIPPELVGVQDAISLALEFVLQKPEGSSVYFSGETDELLIKAGNGNYFPFRLFSEGFRNLIGLIGDIAYRAAELNPHVRNDSKGIVLIDDVDLHLHPSWQRQIIPALRFIFPNIQFILTTHSPQVLSNVKRENVFVLEDFKLVKRTPYTYGKDSNSILWDLFAVKERPEHAEKEFDRLYQFIDDPEKEKEAKIMLVEMEKKYGEDDSEVVQARLHFDFLTER